MKLRNSWSIEYLDDLADNVECSGEDSEFLNQKILHFHAICGEYEIRKHRMMPKFHDDHLINGDKFDLNLRKINITF